jgi:Ca-activated chloride channel homolog
VTFRWPVSILLLAVFAVGQAQEPPTFRADVRLVNVIATVRNQANDLVGTLQQDDFEIRDNGVLQEIRYFGRQTDQPLSVALLIDTSGSTAKDLGYETTAAAKFLNALLSEGNPADRVALYSFNYDIEQGGFTRNYASLERQLKLLKGETGTSLYDAIFFASQALESREGRKAIVIMTDGGDTTSSRDLKAALKAAQMADAVLYPIVVLPITNPAGRNTGGENALQFMAEGTGGRTFYPGVNAQLDKAFGDVIRELRTQYVLGFYPRQVPLTKDPFHKLEVRLKPAGLRVSARNGYYGEAEGGGSGPSRISVSPERPERPAKKKQEK